MIVEHVLVDERHNQFNSRPAGQGRAATRSLSYLGLHQRRPKFHLWLMHAMLVVVGLAGSGVLLQATRCC